MRSFVRDLGLLGIVAACLLCSCAPAAAPPPPVEHKKPTPEPAAPEPPTQETGPYRFRNVPILGGGFVTGIVWSAAARDIVYARTDIGGAYRLDGRGGRWLPLLDHFGRKDSNYLGVESIATDPTDPERVYLAVGTYTSEWAGNGAVLRSSDRGRSFEITPMPVKMGGNEDGRSNGERLAVDPNAPEILYFGSRRDGLFRSADHGKAFAKVERFPVRSDEAGLGLPFVIFDAKSGERGKPTPVLYVGVSSTGVHLYRSRDGGKSFAPVPGQPKGMMPSHAAFDGRGTLYVSYGNLPGPSNVTNGAVWKLDPKRGAWTDITPQRPSAERKFGYGGLAVDPQRPGIVMVTTIDRWTPADEILRTTDGGKSWTALGEKAVRDPAGAAYLYFGQKEPSATGWMGHIAIDPFDSRHAMYVTGQGIWGSDDVSEADFDRATHWSFRNRGLEETVPLALASPPAGAPLLSGVGDICGFRHDDLESPPKRMFENPIFANVEDLDVAGLVPALVVRVGTHPYDPVPKGPRGAFSTDGGTNFSPFAVEPEASQGAGSIAVSADGSTFVWAARGALASYSRDRGKSWREAGGLPPPPEAPGWTRVSLRIAADRVNPKKFYAYDARGGVAYRSDDGAATFAPTQSNFPNVPDYQLNSASLRTVPGREGEAWITTSGGLFRTVDSASTFFRVVAAEEAHAVGFGAAAPGRAHPAVYVIAKIGGVDGFFRSDDAGRSFVRINDDRHQYGGGLVITGDARTAGRVYVGTHGRGILVGDPVK